MSAPSGESVRRILKKLSTCKNVLEVLYYHAKFGGAPISPKTLSFLFCLTGTVLNVRDCAPDFAMKALEYRNDFDAVG